MKGASKVAQQVGALRSRIFRSFSQRNYRVYFAGHSVSVAGTWMQRIGQDWLLLELTGSPLVLGVALFCQFLPVLLLSPWGGLLVDRTDTRRLLMVTQALQAALAVTLAVVTLTGVATVTWVFLLAIGLGIVSAVDVPARQTFVSELVDDADIVNAQALTGVMHNLGRLLGPALAGVLILLVGVGITFVVNAVSFVAVLVSLTAIDVGRLHAVPVQPRGRGQLREGVAYVWRTPELRATVLIVAIVSLLGQNFRVVFPVLASETFAGDAGTYGVMTSALGIGAVLGSFASAAASTSPARGPPTSTSAPTATPPNGVAPRKTVEWIAMTLPRICGAVLTSRIARPRTLSMRLSTPSRAMAASAIPRVGLTATRRFAAPKPTQVHRKRQE